MKDKVSILREDKNYAEYFKAACKDNMDLMELIVDQEERYSEALMEPKKLKQHYYAMIDKLGDQLKKRLDKYEDDSEDEYHGSQNGYKIQRK